MLLAETNALRRVTTLMPVPVAWCLPYERKERRRLWRGFGFHFVPGLERILLALQPPAAAVVGAVYQYRRLHGFQLVHVFQARCLRVCRNGRVS